LIELTATFSQGHSVTHLSEWFYPFMESDYGTYHLVAFVTFLYHQQRGCQNSHDDECC
jgi:hypothetical protein